MRRARHRRPAVARRGPRHARRARRSSQFGRHRWRPRARRGLRGLRVLRGREMKQRGPILAAWARAHLREALGGPSAQRPSEPWCGERAATFVTLRRSDSGALQGCIGTLVAARAIADDVAHHVIAAGMHDPRGEMLVLDAVSALDLEISLLSAIEPIAVADIRPGVDGLVLEHRGARAT